MARSRNIKPGLFKNEVLGVADPLYTLAFEGLWLLADREGRLEDRPLRIKAEIFPYRDGLDIEHILNWLGAEGFVLRYKVGEKRFIQVMSFAKHQNPHCKEPASTIPAPVLHCASTVLELDEHRTGPADSLNRIPDCLELVSDADASVDAGKAGDYCPHQEIVDLYHSVLPMGRQVRFWTPARQAKLRSRWREDTKRQSLDWWRRLFSYIAESDFLTGRTHTPGREPFELDLEWIVTPANLVKIIEGKYHQKEAAA